MFAHTFNKPCNRAYLTTMLVQPDTELPKSQQVSRLMTYGGFNKGQLYGEVLLSATPLSGVSTLLT
jgi:hypothetical protein